jgi:hypothetical protein
MEMDVAVAEMPEPLTPLCWKRPFNLGARLPP